MLGELGLSEWVLGGAGILAIIAAVAIRAFKSERAKRKVAEKTAHIQAGKAEVEAEASKGRIEVLDAKNAALEKAEDDADKKKAELKEVERGIINSSLKGLAAKWNKHFSRNKSDEDSNDEASTN